jgi:fructuronate reductase
MRYVTGIDEEGNDIEVKDPMATRLMAIAANAGDDPEALCDGLMEVTEIFGRDLPGNGNLRAAVIEHLVSLFDSGSAETVRRVAG